MVGRNGWSKLTAVQLLPFNSEAGDKVSIEGVSTKNKVVNGGITIEQEAMDMLALKWLASRKNLRTAIIRIPKEEVKMATKFIATGKQVKDSGDDEILYECSEMNYPNPKEVWVSWFIDLLFSNASPCFSLPSDCVPQPEQIHLLEELGYRSSVCIIPQFIPNAKDIWVFLRNPINNKVLGETVFENVEGKTFIVLAIVEE